MIVLTYLLKTVAIQAIAYAGYRLLLDREPWGHLKRFYLLISLFLSFLIPFLPSGIPGIEEVANATVLLTDISVPAEATRPVAALDHSGLPGWILLLATIYLVGFTYSLFKLFQFISGVKRRLINATAIGPGPVKLVPLPYTIVTHTFWRWVFYSGQELPAPEILAHESAHAIQLHSFDRLLIAFLRAACWFNPVLYWYDLAIRENHELLADQAVLRAGWDRATYQQRLLLALQSINGVPYLSSGAGFALTKKRFQMMYTSSSHWSRSLAKLTAVGLLWAILLVGFGERGFAQAPAPPPPADAPPPPPSPPAPPASGTKPSSPPPPPPAAPAAPPRPPVPVDWSTIAPKIPSASQWQSWQVPTEYGVWIDGKRVENAQLQQYSPSDFSYYQVSKLLRNAVNYGKHKYHLSLMTKAYFDNLRKQ